MFKSDNHTKEVELYLERGESEKAYHLSLFEKRLRLATIVAGIISVVIGAVVQFYG